jgi:outer membrane protein assembly factor BamB
VTFISFNLFAAGPRIILFFAVLFSFSSVNFSQKPVSAKPSADPSIVFKKCWSFPVPDAGFASIAGDARGIFTASFSGDISAMDAVNGEKIWTSELGGLVVSDILIDAKRVYIATNSADTGGSTTIRTLSRDTGITLWSATLPRSEKIFMVADTTGLIVLSEDGRAARFDFADGSREWEKDLSAKITARPMLSAATIFYASEGRINSIDPNSGAAKESKQISRNAIFLGGSQDDGILFTDDRGDLTKWTTAHSVSWQFKAGARITNAIRTKQGILAASDDNFVYMIWDYNGDVIWKIRLSGRVSELVVLSDELAAATDVGENEVFILDLTKGRAVTRFGGADSDPTIGRILSTSEGTVISASNSEVHSYSLDGCGK